MSSLFSSKAPQINFQPSGFNTGGLSANYGPGGYNLSESPTLSGNISSLQTTYGQEASAFGKLASTVQPGFSKFRQAGLRDMAFQQKKNLSNLSTNLAQRRILGSSFGNAQVSQANADYEKNRSDFIAQSYLQELQASAQLTQRQFQAATSGFKVAIDEANLEAGVAASLTGSANAALSSVAKAQAELDANNAAGIGKFFGGIASTLIGKIPGSIFSGGGNGGGGSSSGDSGSFGGSSPDVPIDTGGGP